MFSAGDEIQGLFYESLAAYLCVRFCMMIYYPVSYTHLMAAGTLASTLLAVLTNLFLIIPFYVALYNMNMDQIIQSCSKVNPMMNSVTTMVILGIVPFNLIKYGISCLITFAVYKKISPMIHRFANSQ